MLGLRSLVWVFGESCNIVHGITRDTASYYLHSVDTFSLSPIVLLKLESAIFRPRFDEIRESWGWGIVQVDSAHLSSY